MKRLVTMGRGGSGKTTFFEMWINDLNAGDNTFEVVYLNAWESDYQGDPLLAIVTSLLGPLQPSKEAEPIKETAGKLCKFSLSVGNDVVQRFTGVDMIKAGQYAESKEKDESEFGHACFKLYQERHDLFEKLKKLLRELTKNSEKPILMIIDELDRCRPNYAIEFLETIKHFFDIKGLIFVIGVDKNQLASSAKALFGQQLVFDEYYRKFSHRNINLPVKSQSMTETFCRKLVDEYLSEQAFGRKNRFYYAKHDDYKTKNIVELCMSFDLNARQIHEFFRITAHVLSTREKSNSYLLWGWQIGTFFMVALSIKHRDIYDKIGTGQILLSEFTTFLTTLSLFNKDRHPPLWWANLLYLGTFNDQPLDVLEKQFQELGVWDSSNKKETDFQDQLNKFSEAFSDWGRDLGPVFSKIYERLEGLKTFAEN